MAHITQNTKDDKLTIITILEFGNAGEGVERKEPARYCWCKRKLAQPPRKQYGGSFKN